MTTVTAMRKRFNLVKVDELASQAMEQRREDIVELNREQMLEGKNKDGSDIAPPYAFSTVAIKRAKGQQANFVNLRDTGSFQRAMKLIVTRHTYQVTSTDSKTPDLVRKYGDVIFGLTPRNKAIAWSVYIRPQVVQDIKDITGAQ